MAIKDLIPWNREKTNLTVRKEDEERSLLDIRKQMNRRIDQFFNEFFTQPYALNPFMDEPAIWGDFAPNMDVSETDKAVNVSIELPGMEPEDIHITIDHGNLRITGEKQSEKEEKGKRYYRMERSYGSFQRTFPLPEEVDEDKIEAKFKQGVLSVELPKSKKALTTSKRITVKTD